MRTLIVRCDRCGSKAAIHSSKEVDGPKFKQLYCSCTNPECGHTFVMDLTFNHTLSPSALDMSEAMRERIRTCDRVEQRSLFDSIPTHEKAPA